MRDVIGGLSFTTVAVTDAYSKDKGETGQMGMMRLEGWPTACWTASRWSAPRAGPLRAAPARSGALPCASSTSTSWLRWPPRHRALPATVLVLFRVMSGLEMKDVEVPYGEGDAKTEPVKIGTFALSWGGSLGVLPSYVDFALTDVSGPIRPEDGEPFTYLLNAGLSQATISLGARAAYDINEGTLTLAPITTEVKNAFRVTIETTLADVPEAAFKEANGFLRELPGSAPAR